MKSRLLEIWNDRLPEILKTRNINPARQTGRLHREQDLRPLVIVLKDGILFNTVRLL